MWIALGVIVWVVCSVLAYGISLNWYKREFNYFEYGFGWWFFDLFGPVSLLTALLTVEGKKGLDFNPLTRDERWENFDAIYNSDGYTFRTRQQFDEEY